MGFDDLTAWAARLGVRVTEQPLPCGYCGVWDWRHDRVILHSGLNDVQRRCTLCHELCHVEQGDTACGGRGETRARRRTALTLISVADYATAERIWDGQAWGMACELDVTLQVLDDFRRILHDTVATRK